MSRDQPPAKLPVSELASSITYRLQVPLGLVPLKTERNDPAALSAPSLPTKFVGLNVPETIPPESGKPEAAASSKVKLTPTASSEPPTSDMRVTDSPVGPTKSTSMSSGK